MPPDLAPPLALEPELAAFLQSGLSMHAASCDAQCVPGLSRPLACRVSADRRRVTVFLLASHSGAMLADFRANGRIAVVFTHPGSHRTLQLKGEDAAIEPLQPDDHLLVARQHEGFVRHLVELGWPESLGDTLLAGARGDIVAVGFTVSAAFVQTPGPTAGQPLKA